MRMSHTGRDRGISAWGALASACVVLIVLAGVMVVLTRSIRLASQEAEEHARRERTINTLSIDLHRAGEVAHDYLMDGRALAQLRFVETGQAIDRALREAQVMALPEGQEQLSGAKQAWLAFRDQVSRKPAADVPITGEQWTELRDRLDEAMAAVDGVRETEWVLANREESSIYRVDHGIFLLAGLSLGVVLLAVLIVVCAAKRPLALLVLDLDHFKEINDTSGHPTGDLVLRQVAGHITESLRSADRVFRTGGEEFAVILPGTGGSEAVDVAERIRTAVGTHSVRSVGGAVVHVTASLGVATFPDSADSPEGLVAAADGALYLAKREGRNRVRLSGQEPAKTTCQ